MEARSATTVVVAVCPVCDADRAVADPVPGDPDLARCTRCGCVWGDRRLDHLLVCLPADAVVLAPPDAAERRRAHAARLLAGYA